MVDSVGEIGTILKNPIDLNTAMFNINLVKKVLKILDNLNTVLVVEPRIEWSIFNENFLKDIIKDEANSDFKAILKQNVNVMIRFERTLKNPLVIMSPFWFQDPEIIRIKQVYKRLFLEHNIPVFSQLTYIGVAVANAVKYNKWLENNKLLSTFSVHLQGESIMNN